MSPRLKIAYEKTPYESEVYDHYGDVLWKNGKEIQARYYWKYVLGLEKTEKDFEKEFKYE